MEFKHDSASKTTFLSLNHGSITPVWIRLPFSYRPKLENNQRPILQISTAGDGYSGGLLLQNTERGGVEPGRKTTPRGGPTQHKMLVEVYSQSIEDPLHNVVFCSALKHRIMTQGRRRGRPIAGTLFAPQFKFVELGRTLRQTQAKKPSILREAAYIPGHGSEAWAGFAISMAGTASAGRAERLVLTSCDPAFPVYVCGRDG